MASTFITWLENHQLPCPVKSLLHIECPGCGLQRSFIALLEGDISKSIHHHVAAIPLICLFLLSVLQIKMGFKWGIRAIIVLYIFTLAISFTSYIYRIIHSINS